MEKVIIISGPVIIKDNEVLLNKQGDDNFWKFCGGKQKAEESLVETAIRRSKEELGIEIEILDENPLFLYTKKDTPKGTFAKLSYYETKIACTPNCRHKYNFHTTLSTP